MVAEKIIRNPPPSELSDIAYKSLEELEGGKAGSSI